jgi:predicted phage terminase large subunit-like protein
MSQFNPVEIIKKLKTFPWKSEQERAKYFDGLGLTLAQQKFILQQLEAVNRELGVNSLSIPDDPASFAEKFSVGTRVVWQRARHLDLLNDKFTDMVSGKLPKLIVAEPPRHGKSEFCTFWFPLWYLVKNPRARIIIASYNHSFAETFGRRLRDFVRDRGHEIGLELDSSTTAASRWFVKTGGSVQTVGRGGPLTGKGADLLIIDDPLKDAEEAASEIIREKLWDWWQTTASTRLEPGAICLVVQTRWHFEDLAGKLEQQKEPKWEVLSLKALAEQDDVLGRELGEPLWPERYPIEALNQIKSGLTSYHWSALYQQSPIPAVGGLFQFDWWQYYKKLPDKFDLVIQSWDFSFKDLKKSDYTVGQVWGRKGASFYLIDQIRAQLNAKTSIDAIRAFTHKYPLARAKLFEDKANGPALKSLLQHEVGGIIPIQPRGSKPVRAEAVQPFVQAGNVYLPDQSIAPWISDFVLELAQFPLAAHDDQVDAFTQALNYLAPGGFLALGRAQKEAQYEDNIRHINPQQELHDKFWSKMKKDTDRTNRRNDRVAKGKSTRIKLWQD